MLRLGHTIRRALATLTATAGLLATTPLAAEPPHNDAKPDDAVHHYDFDDDLVAGDTLSAGMELFHVRTNKRGGSLVRARTSFSAELLKSVEAL